MSKPLLSHVLTGRNDNYLGNFKYRLEMSVNYMCRQVAATGNMNQYELLICDWNSETPLRFALNLTDEARRCVRFLEVPPEMVARNNLSGQKFNQAVSLNVVHRRATGQYIMYTPADIIFPFQSVHGLFDLLRGDVPFPTDLRACYLGLERRLIPWQVSEALTLDKLDKYLARNMAFIPLETKFPGIAAGEGAHIIHRDIIHELQGFNETYLHWGYHETEMARRIAQRYPLVKATAANIFVCDLQQRPQRRLSLKINTDEVMLSPIDNDRNWGLGNEEITPLPIGACEPEINSQPPSALPYDVDSLLEHKDGRKSTTRRLCRFLLKTRLAKYIYGWPEKLFRLAGKRRSLYFLRGIAFEIILCQWLNCGVSGCEEKKWLWSQELGPLEKFLAYFDEAFNKEAYGYKFTWTLDAAYIFMALLGAVARLRPRRFLFIGCRNFYMAQTVAAVDPTIDITIYDHWQGAQKDYGPIANVTHYMNFVKYSGYLHVITGPVETAFERLKHTPLVGDEAYQGVFLDLDFLWDSIAALPDKINCFFDDDCLLFLRGNENTRDSFQKAVERHGFFLIGLLPGISILHKKTKQCRAG